MIQSIYTSVSNADIVPCGKKGRPIKSDPIPLLRDNYLGEYRTELEKAKVRKNLGIGDEYSLQWGNIEGFIEQQKDLTDYVEQKWSYTNEISEDITNVKEALDYTIYFISNFKSDTESIIQLKKDVTVINEELDKVNKLISDTEKSLQESIDKHTKDIEDLSKALEDTNKIIEELNEALINIDVDANILNWVKNSLKESKTIKLENDKTIEVIISQQQGNSLQVLEHREAVEADPENGIEAVEEILPGLYVKDLTPNIKSNTDLIVGVQNKQEAIEKDIKDTKESIDILQQEVEDATTYQTELDDSTAAPTTVGGVIQGTLVSQLKGKTINEIIDTVLFPTTVRELVDPSLYYSFYYQLLEVGSDINRPTLTFIPNDAGAETAREDLLTFEGQEVTGNTYDKLGLYEYNAEVSYDAGEYLIDNKGQTTNKRVEAGSITASAQVRTTYPWYAGNTTGVIKQSLVPFGSPSGEITLSLSGKAIIKLPGASSQLNIFKVVGLGESFIDVDLSGWEQTTETLNGITYKVWTKGDEYAAVLAHKINFTLAL